MFKLFVALLSFGVSFSTFGFANHHYHCVAEDIRQPGAGYNVKSNLVLAIEAKKDRVLMESLMGTVFTSDYDGHFNEMGYIGLFDLSYIAAKETYRGTVYKNHYKFEKVNAKATAGSESGMWGYLAVEKKLGEDSLDAHYVFQAGDHMGGTIDYKCEKIYL